MQTLPVTVLLGLLLVALPAMAQTTSETPIAVSANAGLSVDSGMKTLLADPKAKEVIAKYAPAVVEFFASGQAKGLVSAETPLTALAQNLMAINAGLNPENMKKISDALQAR